MAFVMSFFMTNAQNACSQVNLGTISNGGFLGGTDNQFLAVDIPVYSGTTFSLNTIRVNLAGPSTYINVIIRSDASGVPGAVLNTYNNVTITSSVIVGNNFGFDFFQHTIDISAENIVFAAPVGVDRYWMEIQSDAAAWESFTAITVGLPGAFANNGTSNAWSIGTTDYVYELIGECVGVFPTLYCNASAGSCSFETITNVTFSNLNNTTACGPGYNDYTSMVVNVTQGDIVPLSVAIDVDSDEYLFAFIDWNNNGVLDDAGESYVLAQSAQVSQTFTLNITVPANAVVGETRMRIFLAWNEPTTTPCSAVDYGEVEDYTINVQSSTASTQSFFARNFSIYPNPTNNVLNLSVKNGLAINQINVIDINGRTVKTINNVLNSETEINVSDLTSGVYMLNVNTNEGVAKSKFVKN